MKKNGTLIYDSECGRYAIRRYEEGEEIVNHLHCGDTLEVNDGSKWIPTRIEMDISQNWYFVGLKSCPRLGTKVTYY